MYVCLCNALTDGDIRDAAMASAATRPSDVFAARACRVQCGGCTRYICAVLQQCRASTAAADPAMTLCDAAEPGPRFAHRELDHAERCEGR